MRLHVSACDHAGPCTSTQQTSIALRSSYSLPPGNSKTESNFTLFNSKQESLTSPRHGPQTRATLHHAHLPLQKQHLRPGRDAQRPSQIHRRYRGRFHQRRRHRSGDSAWWRRLGVGMFLPLWRLTTAPSYSNTFHLLAHSQNHLILTPSSPQSSTPQPASHTSMSARRLARPRGITSRCGTPA